MRAIPHARTRRSHLGLCSWFSNVYQKLLRAKQWAFRTYRFHKHCLEAGNFKSTLCQVSLIFPALCYCTFYSNAMLENFCVKIFSYDINPTKICASQISYNENFPIYGTGIFACVTRYSTHSYFALLHYCCYITVWWLAKWSWLAHTNKQPTTIS